MKQEIWRFDRNGRLWCDKFRNILDWSAVARRNRWIVYSLPPIGGHSMIVTSGIADSNASSKRMVADTIKSQLAAHGVKVEIRRVKR